MKELCLFLQNVLQGVLTLYGIVEFLCFASGEAGVSVEVKEGRGRCLVASKQIEVGDIVLEERPVAWGPKQLSPVCCVACCSPLFYTQIVWCERCSLPLCSQVINYQILILHSKNCQ